MTCKSGFESVDGVCQRINCAEFDEEDNDICLECEDGYFMHYEDTSCVAVCPDETDQVDLSFDWCAPQCEDGQFVDFSNPLSECKPCDIEIEGCNECHYDTTSMNPRCDSCEDTFNPTWDGLRCSLCSIDQFEEGVDC